MRIEKRIYKTVSANDSESLDYVMPVDTQLHLEYMGGNSALNPSVKVEVIWDADGTPEILFCTHGCVSAQPTCRELVGDGSKVLRIKLTNDYSSAETIGAYWLGWQDE